MVYNERGEIVIHIGKKELTLKELINTINDIKKICEGVCEYCERNNIRSDKDKLELIKEIIKKRVGL